MAVETLFIGGTDLRSISGLYVADWSGLLTEAPYRGDNIVIPGRPGVVSYDKPVDSFPFDIPVTLAGSTHAAMVEALAAVRGLFSGNLASLTRRLLSSSGPGYVDGTCSGEYLGGTSVTRVNYTTGRTILSFVNLDGVWT